MTEEVTDPTDQHESNPDQGDSITLTKDEISKILKQNTHGQDFIETLKQEKRELEEKMEQMQTELSNRQSISDLMEEVRNTNYNPDQSEATPPQVDESALLAKLEQQVFDRLTLQQQEAALEKNWNSVESSLRDTHGERYDAYMTERASELGMSTEQLVQMGATTPKAFMQLMGGEQSMSPAPTRSSERPPVSDPYQSQESEFSKVARQMKDLNTPEGRDANRLWKDPEWQKQQRERILARMNKDGSQFGN